jgi:hypothetical protein
MGSDEELEMLLGKPDAGNNSRRKCMLIKAQVWSVHPPLVEDNELNGGRGGGDRADGVGNLESGYKNNGSEDGPQGVRGVQATAPKPARTTPERMTGPRTMSRYGEHIHDNDIRTNKEQRYELLSRPEKLSTDELCKRLQSIPSVC